VAGRTVARAAGRGQAHGRARRRPPPQPARRPRSGLRGRWRRGRWHVVPVGGRHRRLDSADLVLAGHLPDPAQRLGARYADVGVRHALIDASGGRSIVEALPAGQRYDVARAWYGRYRGCWVFCAGTNDTANVAVGIRVGLAARIDRMMAAGTASR